MAGWIKVDIGPGDTVLDGDLAPLPKKAGGTAAPQVLAHIL